MDNENDGFANFQQNDNEPNMDEFGDFNQFD